MKMILTCEHAGNEVPAEYAAYFTDAGEILKTHRGYDPGALSLFEALKELAVWNSCYRTTRLLIEPNRSLHHPNLFSEYSGVLDADVKSRLLTGYYLRYRKAVEEKVAELVKMEEPVLHLSVHSFTPVLDGKERKTDIGLLYDPGREKEKRLSASFKEALKKNHPQVRVRYNYPYLGKADGFTTHLRRMFPGMYMGIELEVNQRFVVGDDLDPEVKQVIFDSLKQVLRAQ